MEKFAIGALLGALGGALLVTNNYKMRELVKKSQSQALDKIDQFMDEKLDKAYKTLDNAEQSSEASGKKKSKK